MNRAHMALKCLVYSFRKLFFTRRHLVVLFLVAFTLIAIVVIQENGYSLKPYYLVDNPTYVFIDNDKEPLAGIRPNCSALKYPLEENVRISIDNEFFPKVIPLNQNRMYNFSCLNSNDYRPVILLWNRFGGLPINGISDGPLDSPSCPVSKCEITKDRNRLNESAYVLFHMRSPIDEFPRMRFSRQKWIYVAYESQQNCAMCTKLDGFFNLSATFRYLENC